MQDIIEDRWVGVEERGIGLRKKDILAEFSSISVREDSGERIVRNLCSTPVETHVDPTLLLKRQEWEMLAIKPKFNLKKQKAAF